MIQSVSLNELGNLLNMIIHSYDDYLFVAFTLMIVFNIAVFFKYILSGAR